MTEFDLPFPYRDRMQPLTDPAIHDLPRGLKDPDERAVAERLIWRGLMKSGMATVGDILKELEQASPEERRRIADQARSEAGLTTFTEIEDNRRIARTRRDDPPPPPRQGPKRDSQGKAIQQCHHPDCKTLSPGDGTFAPVAAKNWWCPVHEAEAPEGDMDPWRPPPLRYAPGGGFAVSEEAAEVGARHYERLIERTREESRLRREQRQAERERFEELEEARRQRALDELPPGLEWMRPQ
jgi:hypothetical protein